MTPRALVAPSLILTFATAACSTTTIAPPAMPDRAMPQVEGPVVAADSGLARVLLSTDVPASAWAISTISGYRGPYTARTLLCATTPCAVTLPYGDHEIELDALDSPERTSTAIAHVDASTVVLNSTLGRRHSPGGQAAGIMLVSLGVVGLLAAVGVTSKHFKNSGASDGDGSALAAAWSLGIGGLGLGAVFLAANPTIEQPGATREWTPPAHVAGSSLGLRF
jgi:hypothetical protein